jgi:hypothetical protein
MTLKKGGSTMTDAGINEKPTEFDATDRGPPPLAALFQMSTDLRGFPE